VRLATLRGLTLLLGASVVAFICGTPFAILDARHFLEGLRFDASHLVEGHGIVLGRGWIYHLTFSLWYGLGAPLLIAGLAGIGVLAITSWRKAIVVCAFPLLYYFVVGRGYTVFVRYMTPVVPFLCITAAISIVEVMRRLAPPALVSGMVTAAAILIALPSLQRAFAFDRLIAQKDTRVLAEEWTAAHVPAAAWIAQTPPVVPYLDFGAPRPARFATFDPGRGLFVSTEGSVVVPEWITLPASPLSVYTTVPAELQAIAQRDYVPVETIAATHGPELSTWFDQQDEFFVPFTNFTMRDRPGPEIQILRRR